jgi:hypothetical protein
VFRRPRPSITSDLDYRHFQDATHTYKVITPHLPPGMKSRMGVPDEVTFTSSMPMLDLPDPRLLQLHASWAKVAHLSGAAQYIERVLDDIDGGVTSVLDHDGSSYALEMAIARRKDLLVE